MTPEEHQTVMDLRDPPMADNNDWEMLDDVLHGDETLGISHEGGEFEGLHKLANHVSERYVLSCLKHCRDCGL